MSLRYEQLNALKLAHDLLIDLLFTDTRPKTVKELKSRADRCLRHYPYLDASNRPIWSNDEFSPTMPECPRKKDILP